MKHRRLHTDPERKAAVGCMCVIPVSNGYVIGSAIQPILVAGRDPHETGAAAHEVILSDCSCCPAKGFSLLE